MPLSSHIGELETYHTACTDVRILRNYTFRELWQREGTWRLFFYGASFCFWHQPTQGHTPADKSMSGNGSSTRSGPVHVQLLGGACIASFRARPSPSRPAVGPRSSATTPLRMISTFHSRLHHTTLSTHHSSRRASISQPTQKRLFPSHLQPSSSSPPARPSSHSHHPRRPPSHRRALAIPKGSERDTKHPSPLSPSYIDPCP